MKKKLFQGLIVSLFVFTLFISVSNAEFNSSGIAYKTNSTSSTASYSLTTNYTLSNVWNNTKNYYAGTLDETIYNAMIEELRFNGFGLFYSAKEGDKWNVVVYPYASVDLGYYNSKIYLHGTTEETVYWYSQQSSSGYGSFKYSTSASATNAVTPSYSYEPVYMSDSVKLLTMSSNKLYWDGKSYYYEAQNEPEVPSGPEFSTELTDDEIANVVKNFSNSTYWKNRLSYYAGFFIQRNELNGHYAVMMVPKPLISDSKYIQGVYIPANTSSGRYPQSEYDTYSILYVEPDGLQWQPPEDIFKKFQLCDSVDGINFNYVGEISVDDYSKYRIPLTTPIIYSNFVIPFRTLIGDVFNEDGSISTSYTEPSDYKMSDLINSETGESYVFEDVEIEKNPIIYALNKFFKDLTDFLGTIIEGIFNFSDFLLKTFGENVFTLIFSIIIEAFSALVAGISLLVRFAGFVLTLVAIPADSSLFNVLVDGSAWGTHFIEGLNFLKGLSWNNLNLWTFFECFVAALEIIWTVRIVRRHYSQVV